MRTQSINLANSYVNFQSRKKNVQKEVNVEELIAKSKNVSIKDNYDKTGRTIITDNHIIVEHHTFLGEKINIILDKKEVRKAANEALSKICKTMDIEFDKMMVPKKEEPLLDINRIKKLTGLSEAELYAEYTLGQNFTNPELKSYKKAYNALDLDDKLRVLTDMTKRIEKGKYFPVIMKGQPVSFLEKCLIALNTVKEKLGLKPNPNNFKSVKSLISKFSKKIR